MKEVMLYKKLENHKVQCLTCAHTCQLAPGKKGICGIKENRGGQLISLVYGKAVATHVDPIEKKPLFHFYPGTKSFSIATVGCNLHCHHCQNSDISQMPKERDTVQGQDIAPELVVDAAVKHQCRTIAYTYTEPAVFFDYAHDIGGLAHQKSLKNVFVTNGFYSQELLEKLPLFLDAANVDLKSFQDDFYKKYCGARLQPVLEAIRFMKEKGIWVEVTTLVIPGLNDSLDEFKAIADFILSVDPGIPWHISRFHPTYKMLNRPPTPVQTLQMAREIGLKTGLRYVYTGNIPGDEGESTFCYGCGAKLIHRWGFEVAGKRIVDGKCPECSAVIDGVW